MKYHKTYLESSMMQLYSIKLLKLTLGNHRIFGWKESQLGDHYIFFFSITLLHPV